MQNGQASSRATSPSVEIAPGVILEQLDRICASREFHATPRMRAFLRFCIEEALAGRSDRLKGYTIAMQVFDRGEDFDPAQDPVVRIQAGRLRRAVERYYLVSGVRDPILIDIPKGRYIPYFSAQNAAPERRRWDLSTGSSEPLDSPVGPSVAVLPLVNLTDDPEQHFGLKVRFHTVASPPVAYLLFLIGLALLVFEFYTAGVGIAGVVGAGSVILACYGLAALPARGWAVALLVLAMFKENLMLVWLGFGLYMAAARTTRIPLPPPPAEALTSTG